MGVAACAQSAGPEHDTRNTHVQLAWKIGQTLKGHKSADAPHTTITSNSMDHIGKTGHQAAAKDDVIA